MAASLWPNFDSNLIRSLSQPIGTDEIVGTLTKFETVEQHNLLGRTSQKGLILLGTPVYLRTPLRKSPSFASPLVYSEAPSQKNSIVS
jgi:hypothetical protein